MGDTKQKTKTDSQSNSTTSVRPEETAQGQELNDLLMNQAKSLIPASTGASNSAFQLIQALLGGTALPGGYNDIGFHGIDEQSRQAIVNESLRSVPTSLQASGMLDSGAGQALYARGAQNVLSNVAEFNTNNRNALMQMGLTGNYQNQAATGSNISTLSNRLAGLRPVTTIGQVNANSNSVTTRNPFLENFYGNLGGTLGNNVGNYASQGAGDFASKLAMMAFMT